MTRELPPPSEVDTWHYGIIREGWGLVNYGYGTRHTPAGQVALWERKGNGSYRVVAYPAGKAVHEYHDDA